MKKTWKYLLMAALAVCLSMNVTSCKDDNDEKSEEQKAEEMAKASEAADTFWNVVSQLTNNDDIGDDYKNQTFEPTIGQPDEGNALVRIVGTNNMATAVTRFNDLTGAGISESTNDYEWKNDAVGTLTWHKTNDGQTYATVDVNIPQMPRLQQIVYRDGEQMGTNGSFEGRAWYRFGDVVMKDGHYWICVRPAFGLEKKQDSHWICVDKLDDKNIAKCKKGEKVWYVPTKLGEKTEHMKNFAEMLYAMFNPVQWYSYIDTNDKKDQDPFFHDFKYKNLQYHNIGFWKQVMKNWEENDLFKKVMGVDEEIVRKDIIEDNRLNLICWGYSWKTLVSWDLTLKQYTYSGTNMKKEDCLEKEVNMQGWDEFDLRGEYWNQWKVLSQFFDNTDKETPRWVIRHATGKDLGKSYGEQKQLNGCEDVYTFYTSHENLKSMPPEVTYTIGTGQLGEILGKDGKFYGTYLDAQIAGTKPVGIVIYHGEPGSLDSRWDPQARGLVMTLKDVAGLKNWSLANSTDFIAGDGIVDINKEEDILSDPYNSVDREGHLANSVLSNASNALPVIASVGDFQMSDAVSGNRVSNWYVPTFGEMALAFRSLLDHRREMYPNNSSSDDAFYDTKNSFYKPSFYNLFKYMFWAAYVQQLNDPINGLGVPDGIYWTATQRMEDDEAWFVVMNADNIYFGKRSKTQSCRIRPVCAFKD